jgi:hypothetical protein
VEVDLADELVAEMDTPIQGRLNFQNSQAMNEALLGEDSEVIEPIVTGDDEGSPCAFHIEYLIGSDNYMRRDPVCVKNSPGEDDSLRSVQELVQRSSRRMIRRFYMQGHSSIVHSRLEIQK